MRVYSFTVIITKNVNYTVSFNMLLLHKILHMDGGIMKHLHNKANTREENNHVKLPQRNGTAPQPCHHKKDSSRSYRVSGISHILLLKELMELID